MKYGFVAIIFIAFVMTSCKGDQLNVDVSQVDFELKFDRFEDDMFKGKSPEDLYNINQDLLDRGGELYEFYVYDMLRSGSALDDSIGNYLWHFINDSIMRLVYEDIETEFADFSQLENELTDAFKHLKYHMPEAPLPQLVVTYNSTYSFGVISTDSVIGIGLDMYLGPENRITKEVGFPVYIKEKMIRDYLPVDVAQSWVQTNILKTKGETFLANMIYYGKLRYLLEAMMPEMDKNMIMRYTPEEYDFALASEYNIWQYLVDMNWIYTTDIKVKLRFFEEAPTTVGIEESPGRIGQFMGWQMVRSYMEKYPETTVAELMAEENETKILKAYKPKE